MHDDPDTFSADPEAIAREAVEAMRARGTDAPEVEQTLLGAGRAHAGLVKKLAELEPSE